MAEDDLDRELGRRFGQLRAADDARAPGFETVLARVRHPGAQRGRWRLPLVLGAAAAVTLLLLRPSTRHEAPPAADAAAAIGEWKSPTGSLLETPGNELYREPPPAAEPLPDWMLQLERPDPGAPAPSTPARKGAVS